MKKAKSKLNRYSALFKKVINWKAYLAGKVFGFNQSFIFELKEFGNINVPTKMFGPFRENFFDDIYFRYIPIHILQLEKPTFIDIGANVGFFALSAFYKFPKANIYSFEPHPYCFEWMKQYRNNFIDFSWHIFQLAISNKQGEIKLKTDSINDFTTISSTVSSESKSETIKVKAIEISNFIESNNLASIDFLKLDCEGAEFEILYSIPDSVFKRILSLCVETHQLTIDKQNPNNLNIFLQNQGYTTKLLQTSTSNRYIWAWRD